MSERHDQRQILKAASETRILVLACAGDRSAFSELVTRRQHSVRSFLYRLCGEATMAEDLAQQVFLRVWQSLDQLKNHAAFGGWLRQIMINLWKEELRRRKLPLVFDDEMTELNTPVITEKHDTGLDVDKALLQLSPAARLCVMLSHGEGLSHSEISAVTGFPQGTVKSHIDRGCRKLRSLLFAYA
jgi:RNA polymerase sigma-70 factor (ECF subfamily)